MKLKSFCTAKEIVTRLKRLLTEWRKSFPAIHLTRSLILKLKPNNNRKTKNNLTCNAAESTKAG
jgi:hypothetical protein